MKTQKDLRGSPNLGYVHGSAAYLHHREKITSLQKTLVTSLSNSQQLQPLLYTYFLIELIAIYSIYTPRKEREITCDPLI